MNGIYTISPVEKGRGVCAIAPLPLEKKGSEGYQAIQVAHSRDISANLQHSYLGII